MIDQALSTVLRAKLVHLDTNDDPLFNGANAPISSFSAKIELAYRIGLISSKLRRDIHLVRKIRNVFAHDVLGCNFNNNTVKNLVTEIKRSTGIVERHVDARQHFDEGLRGDFQMIISQIVFICGVASF